jgi:hypothetical protein
MDEEPKSRETLVAEFLESPVWTEVIAPEIGAKLVNLDTYMCSELDPWRRYGIVESYKVLKEFRLWLQDMADVATSDSDSIPSDDDRDPERIDDISMKGR